jgi:transcriptional regulator with XRE-family HTH domain
MMSARTDTIDFYRGFGARIRTARIASGLSVQEAADAIGVSVRRFMRFESGQPFRGGHFALSIFARRFGVDRDWLLGGSGPRPRPRLTLIVGGKCA